MNPASEGSSLGRSLGPSARFARCGSRRLYGVALALASVLALAACGGGKDDKPASQTAAKVNKEEITVHQINAVLAQQRNLRPEQTEQASRQVLQRLIDQELAVQKAAEMKIDRDPQVMQRIEAAKRDIVARAYADKLSESAAKPTQEEVAKYYEQHPALFKERRVYQLRELGIEASADQQAAIKAKLATLKTADEMVAYLTANNVKFLSNQATRAAEQLPMNALNDLLKLNQGDATVRQGTKGMTIAYLVGVTAQPVTLERASKAIEQYLLNERKRKLLADDMKSLRQAASVAYVGKFADAASAADAAAKPDDAAPGVLGEAAGAASGVDANSISKGLGLK
jgi:EpsD family peptidyl-prolyl cis-trans isomerase